ncbi:MAG: hypothetical protein Q7J09_09505 [Methanocalculus sp.]|uniref:hypothetical protein n=1 Tax=Methanocalculus sp. TaxID=2004547 RepID=UPI00272212B0|nr:hypothetical protein [Methanocalculus sp.]MDO9540219.1 hypothetical protein [Methanocalculus sp.]
MKKISILINKGIQHYNMLLSHRFLIYILIVSICIISTTTATETVSVERTIETGGDGRITITLIIPDGMIGGITEVIPRDFEYIGTNHPYEQTSHQGQKIHFAIIDEKSIIYSLKGEGVPEITGSILDLTSGEERAIVKSQKSPVSIGILLVALSVMMLLFRRKE